MTTENLDSLIAAYVTEFDLNPDDCLLLLSFATWVHNRRIEPPVLEEAIDEIEEDKPRIEGTLSLPKRAT